MLSVHHCTNWHIADKQSASNTVTVQLLKANSIHHNYYYVLLSVELNHSPVRSQWIPQYIWRLWQAMRSVSNLTDSRTTSWRQNRSTSTTSLRMIFISCRVHLLPSLQQTSPLTTRDLEVFSPTCKCQLPTEVAWVQLQRTKQQWTVVLTVLSPNSIGDK